MVDIIFWKANDFHVTLYSKVFKVADYEFDIWFSEFKMADPIHPNLHEDRWKDSTEILIWRIAGSSYSCASDINEYVLRQDSFLSSEHGISLSISNFSSGLEGVLSGRYSPIFFFLSAIMTIKIFASKKISSLENHNYRIRHNKDLVRCSFSSLSNSLKMHFSYLFFSVSLRGFIKRNFSAKNYRTRHSTEFVQSSFSSKTDSLETFFLCIPFEFRKWFYWMEFFFGKS